MNQSLYLTIQLLEIGVPIIIVLNKKDKIKEKINYNAFLDELGCMCVLISAKDKTSIADLKNSMLSILNGKITRHFIFDKYSSNLQYFLRRLSDKIIQHEYYRNLINSLNIYPEFLAIRKITSTLKQDKAEVSNLVLDMINEKNALRSNNNASCDIHSNTFCLNEDFNPDTELVKARCALQENLLIKMGINSDEIKDAESISDKIDGIVLNKFLALPIFILMLCMMLFFSINVGGKLQELFEIFGDTLFVELPSLITIPIIKIFISAACIGIKTVLMFVPIIGSLYFYLSILEESGYISRISFIAEKFTRKVGLPGKAIPQLLMSFGCNVPAIMAARNLENWKDRVVVALSIPFSSCSARLTTFVVLSASLFKDKIIVIPLYLIGILFGFVTSVIANKAMRNNAQEEISDVIIELPNYEMPNLQKVFARVIYSIKNFIFGAGKAIMVISITLYALNTIDVNGDLIEENKSDSILIVMSKVLMPAFSSFGIKQENWPIAASITSGLLAKETVIGVLHVFCGGHDIASDKNINMHSIWDNFISNLKDWFSDVQINNDKILRMRYETTSDIQNIKSMCIFQNQYAVFAYMLFILLYFPCISVFAVMRQEFGLNIAILSSSYCTLLAYVIATLYYQISTFIAFGVISYTAFYLSLLIFAASLISLYKYLVTYKTFVITNQQE
ncbi:MAG: ferrous iron transport protein B [Proteobacteria bacterium]|nr:ferrous iron transport protein B [Pseudomonadota bacterium]